MRDFIHLFLWSSGLIYLLFASPPVRAQVVGAAVDQILPAISNPTLANLKAAEAAWQSQEPAAHDVLTRYTMALALVANNRHQPAFELVDGIPPSARRAGPLRRLFVWLAIKVRKDELGQAELQSLVDDFKLRSSSTPSANDLDDVQFVSKLVVYLEHIAERDEPLAPGQAKTWRQAIEALPATWNADLANIQTALTTAHAKRQRELEDNYKPWRQKTDQELVAAQQKLAGITAQDATAQAAATTAIAAQQAFAATAKPQIQALEASFKQLTAQRNSIRAPRKPSRPSPPTRDKDGKSKTSDSEYRRELREYEDDLRDYEKEKAVYDKRVAGIDAQLANANASALVLYKQEEAHQKDIAAKKADIAKIAQPLKIAEKNELRLKLLLADRPTWDSPGTLATLRSLDAYAEINLAREVARIQAARLK